MAQFADVLLPLPLFSTFTYSIPEQFSSLLRIGSRVLVPFGRKKYYTAIVTLTHDRKPEGFEVKEILEVLDSYPILKNPQLKLWNWISEYYLCSPGDVFKAAVPSGLKIESETFVQVNPDFEVTVSGELRERETIVLDFIGARDRVQIAEIERSTGFRNVEAIVMRLLDKDAIFVSEKVVQNYKPKTQAFVTLCCERGDENTLHEYFDKVRIAKKQETLLMNFLEISHWIRQGESREVLKNDLLEQSGCTSQILKALCDKGIMRIYKKEINRFASNSLQIVAPPKLTSVQQEAYWKILDSFKTGAISLLYGVTSSGKTEIYINLITEMLRHKKQVLYLVPEIALTTQLTQRLHRVFGNSLLIYHSKFSDNERVDIWKKLLNSNEPCVVLGVRSSVFLPFGNLGLVIVDEEHDTSFKQQEPAPRYNARNVAMVLASMHGAKTLLGSGTPSIESYHNALIGKYSLIELTERYKGIEMPFVETVDMRQARKQKKAKGIFSYRLIEKGNEALRNGQQVILFQNRRGYSPMIICNSCGWVPKCENCDVSLTYHKHNNTLTCHYCGYTKEVPTVCPACGEPALEIIGYGTERIEDDVEKTFPDYAISRMDLDTTRNKNSYERIIDDFSNKRTQILVGTQMVTKGLDFGAVSLVGVLNADTMLNFPDFRAHERAFNMLEQVAGRAGRAGERGTVLIQTTNPEHPVLKFVANHDFVSYYKKEIEEREYLKYPPFTKIINIYMKHRNEDVLIEMSARFSNMLRQVFGNRILGPETPLVGKIQQFYIRQIMLKMENEASMKKVKNILRQIYENMLQVDSRMKSTLLYYDVDPM